MKWHWGGYYQTFLIISQHWLKLWLGAWWHQALPETMVTQCLDATRTTRTPAFWGYPRRLMIAHSIESYWIPSQKKTKSKLQNLRIRHNFKFLNFKKHYMRHIFCSCLIRCANMKWIRRILLKMESGRDSVHRRTDGQMHKVKPVIKFVTL